MPYRSEGEIEKIPDSIRSRALALVLESQERIRADERVRENKLALKRQRAQRKVKEILSKIKLNPDKVMSLVAKFAKRGDLEVKLWHEEVCKHFLPFWFRVRYFWCRKDMAAHIATLLKKDFQLNAYEGRCGSDHYPCIYISWEK